MATDNNVTDKVKIHVDSANNILKYIENRQDISDKDKLCSILAYQSSENLIEHSKTLKCWTIVIGVSTILLFISAVAQLIKLFFCP